MLCPWNEAYGLHSPESLPSMHKAGRDRQQCLYCKEQVRAVYIEGVFQFVVYEYIIEEEPW